MPQFETAHFGLLDYQEAAVIDFPYGLPAFEEETRFLPVEQAATAPVIFLQSLSRPDLAFITLPVELVDSTYQLAISPEDLRALELPEDRQPAYGSEVLCLAIITVAADRTATANLMAPVVVNLATRRAVQAIQTGVAYSLQHPLICPSREAPCL